MNFVNDLLHFNLEYDRQLNLLLQHQLPVDLGYPSLQILLICQKSNQAVTVTKIINLLGLDPSYASRLVKRLVKMDYLTKTISSTDRRVRLLKITSTGQSALLEYYQCLLKRHQQLIDKLSFSERKGMHQSINRIHQIIEGK